MNAAAAACTSLDGLWAALFVLFMLLGLAAIIWATNH